MRQMFFGIENEFRANKSLPHWQYRSQKEDRPPLNQSHDGGKTDLHGLTHGTVWHVRAIHIHHKCYDTISFI